jgi:hypothetical protein
MGAMLTLQHFAEHEDLTLIRDPIALNNLGWQSACIRPLRAYQRNRIVILEERKNV